MLLKLRCNFYRRYARCRGSAEQTDRSPRNMSETGHEQIHAPFGPCTKSLSLHYGEYQLPGFVSTIGCDRIHRLSMV
jgi:hypothetical protein